jgi:hypothetical protein
MAVRGSQTGPASGQLVDGPAQPEAVEVIVHMVEAKRKLIYTKVREGCLKSRGMCLLRILK